MTGEVVEGLKKKWSLCEARDLLKIYRVFSDLSVFLLIVASGSNPSDINQFFDFFQRSEFILSNGEKDGNIRSLSFYKGV